MNLPAEWMPCLELAGLLALEFGLIVGVAIGLEHWARSAMWQRAIWQAATASLLLLVLVEISGLARDLAAWACACIRPVQVEQTAAGAKAQVDVSPSSGESWRLTGNFRQRVAERLARNRPFQTENSEGRATERLALAQALPVEPPTLQEPEPAEPFLQGRSLPWPELVWFIGMGAVLGTIWLARCFFFLFQQRRSEEFDAVVRQKVAALAMRLGIHRRVRTFESARLLGPIAFGVVRPTIGLPTDFVQNYTPVQQEVMLAHELAHLSGHDPAWQWLADVLVSVVWWHPLAWWARRRLSDVSESAADEASTLITDGPGLLAECLLQLASRMPRRQPLGWLGVTGTGFRSGLGRRIEKLVRLTGGSWSPLCRVRVNAVRILVPVVLVAAAIVCTAWIGPQQHGEPMNTLRQNWKRSAATLALFAAFGAEQSALPRGALGTPQDTEAAPPAQVNQTSTLNADPANPATPARKTNQIYRMDRRLVERYGLSGNPSVAAVDPAPAKTARPDTAPDSAEPAEAGAPDQQPEGTPLYQMDPKLMRRYGLVAKGATSPPALSATARASRGKQQIEAKLSQILLNDVLYDNLPLSEVVRDLQEQARRRDPSRQGLNILVSNVPEVPVSSGAIDPMTGQPIPVPSIDLSNVAVKLHLRDVRLKDVLDAMTRVADQPIKYSVEEYGIVFSPGSGAMATIVPAAQNRLAEPPRLQVRTFKVDTNTFLAGLESAFGISVPHSDTPAESSLAEKTAAIKVAKAEEDFKRTTQLHAEGTVSEQELNKAKYDLELAHAEMDDTRAKQRNSPRSAASRDIQQALRQLLQQLTITMDGPSKAVFYNDLTGILMVRATTEDLEVVQAAVETLGGRALRQGISGLPQNVGPTSANAAAVPGKINRAGALDLSPDQN